MWSVISNTTVHVVLDRNQYFKIRLRKLRYSQGHSLPQPRISAKEHRPFSFEKILTKLHRSAKWIENRECLQVQTLKTVDIIYVKMSQWRQTRVNMDECKRFAYHYNIWDVWEIYWGWTEDFIHLYWPDDFMFQSDRGFYGDVCDSFSGWWQSSGMLPLSRVI